MFFFAPPPNIDASNSIPSLTVSQISTPTSAGALDVTIKRRGFGAKRHTVAPTTMSSASKLLMHGVKNCVSSQLLLLLLLFSRWESAWNKCFCPH